MLNKSPGCAFHMPTVSFDKNANREHLTSSLCGRGGAEPESLGQQMLRHVLRRQHLNPYSSTPHGLTTFPLAFPEPQK